MTMTTEAVRERPVLFSGPMIRAILEGRKVQTRRVVKPQPVLADTLTQIRDMQPGFVDRNDRAFRCPYGRPGDRLWVREAWAAYRLRSRGDERETYPNLCYAADSSTCLVLDERIFRYEGDPNATEVRWRPSIHMPRWASRITLEITDVRVERLGEITEEDARAEGISVLPLQSAEDPSAWWQSAPGEHQSRTARGAFAKLWDSINGPRGYGWDANPWVWRIEFRVLEAPHAR